MPRIWTKSDYIKFCKDVHADCISEDIIDNTEMLYDIAKDTLNDDKGLKLFMKNTMKVQDCVGRLVNDIASPPDSI